jgi:hypothetical protein
VDNFLSHLDPTVLGVVITAVLGFFTHKKGADIKAGLKDALRSALKRVALQLIDRGVTGAGARAELEAEAQALLGRMAIKRSDAVDALVHAGVEAALTELESHLFKQRGAEMQTATDKLDDAAQRVLHAFDDIPTKPTIPRLDLDIEQVDKLPDPAPAAADKVRDAIAKDNPR